MIYDQSPDTALTHINSLSWFCFIITKNGYENHVTLSHNLTNHDLFTKNIAITLKLVMSSLWMTNTKYYQCAQAKDKIITISTRKRVIYKKQASEPSKNQYSYFEFFFSSQKKKIIHKTSIFFLTFSFLLFICFSVAFYT